MDSPERVANVTLNDIHIRTLDRTSDTESREYYRLFWDLPLEHNEYFSPRSDAFVDDWIAKARSTQDPSSAHEGIALDGDFIVGLHLLHRFEEWEQIGVHIAGLWVRPGYVGLGIARTLKENGEKWARSVGATFMNTNVHPQNHRMLSINERAGFSLFRYNLRKRL